MDSKLLEEDSKLLEESQRNLTGSKCVCVCVCVCHVCNNTCSSVCPCIYVPMISISLELYGYSKFSTFCLNVHLEALTNP